MKKEQSDRTQRLADALRANLRRRKGQARDQAAAGPIALPIDQAPDVADTPAADASR